MSEEERGGEERTKGFKTNYWWEPVCGPLTTGICPVDQEKYLNLLWLFWAASKEKPEWEKSAASCWAACSLCGSSGSSGLLPQSQDVYF